VLGEPFRLRPPLSDDEAEAVYAEMDKYAEPGAEDDGSRWAIRGSSLQQRPPLLSEVGRRQR